MKKLALILSLAAVLPPTLQARGRTYSTSRSSSSSRRTYSTRPANKPAATRRAPSTRCTSCARDARGRIKRSDAAKHKFQKQSPCPVAGTTSGGCPGYDIDHKVPLSKGGADAPSNMQWLTDQQHKAKHAAK